MKITGSYSGSPEEGRAAGMSSSQRGRYTVQQLSERYNSSGEHSELLMLTLRSPVKGVSFETQLPYIPYISSGKFSNNNKKLESAEVAEMGHGLE